MRWTHGLRARLRLLFRSAAEARMEEEMRLHLEMQTEQYVREGMSPEEARRRAVLAFGGVEGHKESIREGRTLAWLGGLSLDLKLAWRMLIKHPGLTLVGGLGLALAVAIGAFFFDFSAAFLHSTLPFDEGERVVAIESWDTESNAPERQIVHDYTVWREELESVKDVGAWSPAVRNLIVPGGPASPVEVAAMTASGFRLARVPPLLGRTLVEEDGRNGAPPVTVIGHDVWQTRFGGDPDVIGREVRLGDAVHTVVGVMPEGFRFPVNHGLWIPLRADPSDHDPREGPGIFVFGRLVAGGTLQGAQAELTTIGLRMAAAFPESHERLRPRIVPYTRQFMNELTGWEFALVQFLIILLLAVICVNVAVLVYARTVTRAGEITVRSALGASRRRIVAQLFAEALVLSLAAAAVGLTLAGLVLEWWESAIEQSGNLSFWIDFGLSPGTVLYAVGLAVLGAVIVGVIPALKATGRGLRSGLSELGGATGMRLGRTWTALIVAQVAIAAAVLPAAAFGVWNQFRYGFAHPGFAVEEFLTARIEMDVEPAHSGEAEAAKRERAARYGDRLGELVARLQAEPDVAGVTFAAHRVGGTLPASIEVDGMPMPPDSPTGHSIRTNHVDAGYFDAFGNPVIAGRAFRAGDVGPAATSVIVNRAFVSQVLGGRNPLGRQIRYAWRHRSQPPAGESADSARWYEVVGVVSDMLVVGVDPGESEARLYHPTAPGQIYPASLTLRMRSEAPADFGPRLRELTAAVDPTLQVHDILPLDEALRQKQNYMRVMGLAMALITLSVILLSAAGIHALMSFTVVRRRREIGIRAALGAHPRRLLASIFARAVGQLAIGLGIGISAAAFLNRLIENLTGGQDVVFVSAAAALMMVVGLLAALGPARRGLQIEPMEALRAE